MSSALVAHARFSEERSTVGSKMVQSVEGARVPRPRGCGCLAVLARSPSDPPGRAEQERGLASLGGLMTAEFAFVLRTVINGAPRSVPVVFDDPGELDAITRALEIVNASGGFDVKAVTEWRLTACVQAGSSGAGAELGARLRAESELLERAVEAFPGDAVEIAPPGDGQVLMRLGAVVPDGAKLEHALHRAARAVAPVLAAVGAIHPTLKLEAVAAPRFRARCRITRPRLLAALGRARDVVSGQALARAVAALGAGAREPSVAAAHNAVIESGVAAVALAFGNAPAHVIAASRRHAARAGGCLPLCTWRLGAEVIEGELELPLDITAHGQRRVPGGDLLVEPAGCDLGMLAATVGMAASVVVLEDALGVRLADVRRAAPPPRKQRRAA